MIKNLFTKLLFQYDLDSLEGIQAIPDKQNLLKYFKNGNFTDSILYKLQKKATDHKKNNQPELALACLDKAFHMMLVSDYYYGDYADKYVTYLKSYRYFDKAREVQKIINSEESKSEKSNHKNSMKCILENAKRLKTDLLEARGFKPADTVSAIYRNRIYSISGRDKRFPKLPMEIFETGIDLYPFVYGVSEPTFCKRGKEIECSNRPFIDNRSKNEKKQYDEQCKEIENDNKNRDDYDWIWENLPDISPKSLSGYVRGKNTNSNTYQKIVAAAKEKNYIIE